MNIFTQLAKGYNEDFKNYILEKKPICVYNLIDNIIEKFYDNIPVRNSIMTTVSFHFQNSSGINSIMDFVGDDSIVEVGAGQGLTSGLLIANGFDSSKLNVTDKYSSSWNNAETGQRYLDTIEDLDCIDAIDKYSTHNVLMMMWPPGNNPMAVNSLKRFNGNKLVYGGDSHLGITGDDDFFEELNENWELGNHSPMPAFRESGSNLEFYTRK
jgi:hypothetical protein